MSRYVYGFIIMMASVFACEAQQIIVFPSDVWMGNNGFGKDMQIQGETKFVCDYATALRKSSEMKDVITRLGKLFKSEGFEITPLDNALKEVGLETAISAMENITESPTDMIISAVSPDIKIDLSWDVRKVGFNNLVDINMEASDPYTGSQMAAVSFTSPEPTKYLDIKGELETMLKGDFNNFMDEMKEAWRDRIENGQKVTVVVVTQDDAEYKLTSMVGDKPLRTLIGNFLQKYAKNNKMGKATGAANKYSYRDVRIEADPNAAQELQDALVDYISNTLQVPCYGPAMRIGSIRVNLGQNPN